MHQFKKLLLVFFVITFIHPINVFADVAGLIPCNESAIFTKRLDSSVRKLESRLKKYDAGSPPTLALEQQIKRTQQRFDRYSKSGLLCGKDGLPHLITDGRWNHSIEFAIPGLMFLYISGWIGWVGRKYIRTIGESANATEKEIIIDVPLALKIMSTGFIWPISAWQEYVSGTLLADVSEITVSPR
jgi:photosystem I subunit III